jgi:CRP-like cAMP-binding protein
VITQKPGRDVRAVLDAAGLPTTTTEYPRGDTVYVQGHPADCVMYILDGAIKLSVVSLEGQEAVVAMLGPGDFFGEG